MSLIIIPLMTAILAWFIAWLFVKLIFWPNNAGILNLLQKIDIEKIVNKENSAQQFEAILPAIDLQLNEFFTHKLSQKMPMISMFIGEKTIVQLKAVFVEELREIFPSLIQQMVNKTKNDFSLNLSSKWGSIMAAALFKWTRKFRFIAFSIGLAWGILIVILTHNV